MYNFLYTRLLSRIDPERIHHLSIDMLAAISRSPATLALLQRMYAPTTTYPPITLWGRTFAHPLGLAAGFDKDARCVPALLALGFSFVEVGTITPLPQPGNPRPRLFRLPEDQALINRMGFPSGGIQTLNHRQINLTPKSPLRVQRGDFESLEAQKRTNGAVAVPSDSPSLYTERGLGGEVNSVRVSPVWVSLGKNKTTPLADAAQDYGAVLNARYDSGDAFVVNVSSPNTPELRALQTRAYLDDLLSALMAAVQQNAAGAAPKPLLVKIAPDLTWAEIDDIVDLALAHGLGGIIATNTTTARDGLRSPRQYESGGLSGAPLRERSTAIIRYIHQVAPTLPIIGVGGVFTGDDVWEKLAAGATLVQAYTGFIYRGPTFVKRALAELHERMEREAVQIPRIP